MSVAARQVGVLAEAIANDIRQAVRLARGAGFGGVLIQALTPELSVTELSSSGRREFRHMLAAQDQQLVGFRVEIGPKGVAPGADVDRVVARVERVMESAAGLGCRLLCIDLGPLPEPARPPAPRPTITPEQAGLIILPEATILPAPDEEPSQAVPFDPLAASQVDLALVEVGRHADRYGVTVAFRSELASFAALERALKAADCPWFGVDLDPVAILRDAWSVDEVFSRLGTLVRHVRARDAIVGSDRRTRPATIGQGSTDWRELLAALDDAAYTGWLTVDPLELPNRTAAATTALAHLRQP